jgi:glutamate--cysteine ligase
VPVGITAQTIRFLDLFLLHCLLTDSPPDTPAEIAALAENQHLVAARGREPGLKLTRADGSQTLLSDWAAELLAQCAPMARMLDEAQGGTAHAEALAAAKRTLADPHSTPSARVLRAMAQDFDDSYIDFLRQQSEQTRKTLMDLPYSEALAQRFKAQAEASLVEQAHIEAADTVPFDEYLRQYLSPARMEV